MINFRNNIERKRDIKMYQLFTDASLKEINGVTFYTIAGAIFFNGESVIEFCKSFSEEKSVSDMEILAIEEGVSIAVEKGIKEIECFGDNLNSIKLIKEEKEKVKNILDMRNYFNNIKFYYISRNFNTYANALCNIKSNKLKYEDYKYDGIEKSLNHFKKNVLPQINEFKNSEDRIEKNKTDKLEKKIVDKKARLEKLLNRTERSKKDSLEIESIFKNMYRLFILKQNIQNSDEKEFRNVFIKMLDIKYEELPKWLTANE